MTTINNSQRTRPAGNGFFVIAIVLLALLSMAAKPSSAAELCVDTTYSGTNNWIFSISSSSGALKQIVGTNNQLNPAGGYVVVDRQEGVAKISWRAHPRPNGPLGPIKVRFHRCDIDLKTNKGTTQRTDLVVGGGANVATDGTCAIVSCR